MQHRFDVFITGDRNLSFQQDTTHAGLAVVVLSARGTQLHRTMPLMPKVLGLLPTLSPGHTVWVTP